MRGRFLLSAALMAAIAAFAIQPAQAHGDLVALPEAYAPGTIVVKTSERHLYLVVGPGQAIRYPVGVGRAGQQWSGTSTIDAKYVSPDWAPPPDIRAENPKLPPLIPGGSPHNPMGVAAMTLAGLDYAIHGTNQPSFDRPFRLARLHPNVQRRHHGFVWPRRGWDAGGGDLVMRWLQCGS